MVCTVQLQTGQPLHHRTLLELWRFLADCWWSHSCALQSSSQSGSRRRSVIISFGLYLYMNCHATRWIDLFVKDALWNATVWAWLDLYVLCIVYNYDRVGSIYYNRCHVYLHFWSSVHSDARCCMLVCIRKLLKFKLRKCVKYIRTRQ